MKAMTSKALSFWLLGAYLLVGGVSFAAPPASGGSDDQTSCVAACQDDTDQCAKMCKERAPQMGSRCTKLCTDQQKTCVKECKEPENDSE